MPTKSHHRSRSSVDRVFDLLGDLQENQISLLLDDFNHTTASNVPVSDAIALFDPAAKRRRSNMSFGPSSSPVRTLQAELERRNSRRISSAPAPTVRSNTASPPSPPVEQHPAPPPSVPQSPASERLLSRPSLTISPPDSSVECPSSPSSYSVVCPPFSPDYSVLTPPSPDTDDFDHRPTSASSPERRLKSRARSYKRISRPFLLSPTATAELHELLLAYFQESPTSATTTATPSPITPKTSPCFGLFSPIHHQETDGPGLDLLEPSPTRLPVPMFSSQRMVKQASMESMNSIFEVLASR